MAERHFSKVVSECGEECPAFKEDGWWSAVHKCELWLEEEILAEDFHDVEAYFPEWCPLETI